MEHTTYARLEDAGTADVKHGGTASSLLKARAASSFTLGRPLPCEPIHVASHHKASSFTPGLDTLVHVVPIGAVQLIDFSTDLISLFIFHTEALHVQFTVGAGSMLLSIMVTWWAMLFRGGQTVGFDEIGGWRKLLIMALVPFNLHTLVLGVVVAEARSALSDKSTKEDRASVQAQLSAFAMFKSFETGLESVPFAVLSVSALSVLSTGGTHSALGLAASLAVSLLSISYGFYSQATSVTNARNDYRLLPRGTSAQLFLCVSYHVCWVIGATGMLVAASSLGPLRSLGPLLLLACGGGSFAAAQVHLDVVSPALILVLSVAGSPGLSIFDHVLFGGPINPAFYDSSPLAHVIPILRRAVVMAFAISAAISTGSLPLAALTLLLGAVDALVYRRLMLLGGLTQHPDATGTPLVLVPSDSPHCCIFQHTAALRTGSALSMPSMLTSHPGRGLVVSVAPHLWHECNDTNRPLWYHRTAIGEKQAAVAMRMDGRNLLVVTQTDDSPRTLALCVEDNTFSAGHHIVALGNAHDESKALYDDPWPTYSGYPKTMQRTDGRLFTINSNDTISPVGAPHLVLGLRNALQEATGAAARLTQGTRTSSPGALAVPFSLMPTERFSQLHKQQATEGGRWLLDAIESLTMQVGDTLQDIEMRQARGVAEKAAAGGLPDGPGRNSKIRSDTLCAAHLKEARSRIKSMNGMTAHSANRLWESACHLVLETCETLMAAMLTYSVAQQEALARALRAYVPQNDDDPAREALMQTEALCAFGEAIEAALRAAESARVSEPAPPPHPMRGTPLPEVLHSGVLTRKNAFGSLFKWKQKNEVGVAPDQDRSRDFDLSCNVERCNIFLSHSWGDDGEKKVALLAFYFEYSTQIASLVIVCLVMAIFLFAFAVSLTSALKMHTSTLTIVLPLAPLVVLLLSLTWFALAQGYLPTKLTPAFLSERVSGGMTLWVDKTCVDQSNVAGFLNQGIDHFMMRCDRMMAFPSTSYFTRAWCMYELATWCHEHRHNLDGKLFLVSLDWDHFASAYKTAELSKEELDMMTQFSLDNVRSFKAADQADVLAAIRKRWGTEAAFEAFVQTEMPKVFARCKQQYYGLVQNTATETLEKALQAG